MEIFLSIIIFVLMIYIMYKVEKDDNERKSLLNEIEIFMRMEQLLIYQSLESKNLIAKDALLKNLEIIRIKKHKKILNYVKKYDKK